MAKKRGKKVTTVVEEPEVVEPETPEVEVDEGLTPGEEAELEAQDRLSEFQQKFTGQDYKVRVEYYDPDKRAWTYVDTAMLDGFEPYTYCTALGSGRYRTTLLDTAGKYVKSSRQEVNISERAAGLSKKEEAAPAVVAPPAEDPMIKVLMAQLASMGELVKSVLVAKAATPAPTADPVTLPTMIDALAKMKGLTELGKGSGGTSSIKEAFEVLTAAKGLLGDGGGGGDETLLDQISKATAAAKEMGLLTPPRRPLPAPTVAAPTAAVPTAPMPAPPTRNEEPMPKANDDPQAIVQKYVPVLVDAAKRKEPHGVWADFILDRLEKEIVPAIVASHPFATTQVVLDMIEKKAAAPEEVEKIFVLVPEFIEHSDWVRAVVAQALTTYRDSFEDDDPTPDAAPEDVPQASPETVEGAKVAAAFEQPEVDPETDKG